MAVAFVKRICSATDTASTNPKPLTVSGNTTAGNTVILVAKGSGGIRVNSVSDSRGNTWQVDEVSTNTTNARVSVASAVLTTALLTGDTVTVTYSAGNSAGMAVYEYSGLATVSYVDGTPTQGNATTGTSLSVSITTANANDLVFTAVACGTSETVTGPTGFTVRDSGQTGNASGCVQAAEDVVAATGTYAANWSWTTTTANAVAVVAYKAAGAAATTSLAVENRLVRRNSLLRR